MYAPATKPASLTRKPRIFPAWDEIDHLRTPLTEGERVLARYLDDNLPPSWEIYVQPHMNGNRPDIVILNPQVGLMIYEVKDWNLEIYTRHKEGKWERFRVREGPGWRDIPDPRRQVERYRKNLIYLYAPFLGMAVSEDPKALVPLRTGLYFHCATTAQAQAFAPCGQDRCTVIGRDALRPGNIANVVPDAQRPSSLYIYPDWLEGFNGVRAWLSPQRHEIERNRPLVLTSEQRRHSEPAPGRHQRLRGVAGSGKTAVLAQRAANLAAAGKRVLVVAYNITLIHYIRDMVARTQVEFDWSLIEFTYFHGFCRDFLMENYVLWPESNGVDEEEFFDKIVPERVITALKDGRNCKHRRYDAILIDEGQDFTQAYYDLLREFLTPDDEVLVVADYRQNVYLRESTWLDGMHGKFRGPWRELKASYRLPPRIVEEANRFAERYLPESDFAPLPAQQPELFEPLLVWREVHNLKEALDTTLKAVRWLMCAKRVHPSDIVLLVPTHKEGWSFVRMFERCNICTNHVFEEDHPHSPATHKSHKRAFFMAKPCLKVCTIHSFKGWELHNIIVVTPDAQQQWDNQLDYLIYIAMTRARQNLIVLNRNPKYVEFGSTWASTWQDEQ